MKKLILSLSARVLVSATITPAHADTYIYNNVRHRGYDRYQHHRPSHHRPRYHHNGAGLALAMMTPFLLAPALAPRQRTVVYETRYVQPQTVYVAAPPMQAIPTSPDYYNGAGLTCREYQTTGNIAGGRGNMYGTACLQPDGAWRVVN